MNYLNKFKDIFDYCKKVYFIYNEDFIKKLIANGQNPISNASDVVNYMNLAMEFWDMKEQYFNKLHDQ